VVSGRSEEGQARDFAHTAAKDITIATATPTPIAMADPTKCVMSASMSLKPA
jgi:hypothetical protein